jgi:hypothetical protein
MTGLREWHVPRECDILVGYTRYGTGGTIDSLDADAVLGVLDR